MALVVFDIDGTLTRSTGVDDECFVRALRDEVGLSGFDCDWANYPHATDSGLTQEIVRRQAGREATAGEQARVQRRMVELLRRVADREPERFAMVAGATALMRRLSEKRGWAVSIATGAWKASAMIKLRTAGVDAGGYAAAFADDAISRQDITLTSVGRALGVPASRGVLRTARERWGAVVYVGDGVWDARTSRELGIGFVGVRVEGDFERLRAEGATRLLRDYEDLDAAVAMIQRAVDDGG